MLGSITYDEAAGHEFHGNQHTGGKGGASKGSSTALAGHMLAEVKGKNGKLKPDAGFTIDARTKSDVTKGYAVDTFPHKSLEINPAEHTHAEMKEKIKGWLEDNKALLHDDRVKIGGWVDPATGHFWVGATRVYPEGDKQLAVAMGRRNNQIAIANLSAIHQGDWDHAFVQTGGTGKATGDSMPKQKKVLVLFDNTASADEILEAMLSHAPKGSVTQDANPEGINQYTGARSDAVSASNRAWNTSAKAEAGKVDHSKAAMHHGVAAKAHSEAKAMTNDPRHQEFHNMQIERHRAAREQHSRESNKRGGNDL
jgi:hypothetical protein